MFLKWFFQKSKKMLLRSHEGDLTAKGFVNRSKTATCSLRTDTRTDTQTDTHTHTQSKSHGLGRQKRNTRDCVATKAKSVGDTRTFGANLLPKSLRDLDKENKETPSVVLPIWLFHPYMVWYGMKYLYSASTAA